MKCKKRIYNIAQNQSFVQREIGEKYKTMQNGPPYFAYFFRQVILPFYKNGLKSILVRRFLAIFQHF